MCPGVFDLKSLKAIDSDVPWMWGMSRLLSRYIADFQVGPSPLCGTAFEFLDPCSFCTRRRLNLGGRGHRVGCGILGTGTLSCAICVYSRVDQVSKGIRWAAMRGCTPLDACGMRLQRLPVSYSAIGQQSCKVSVAAVLVQAEEAHSSVARQSYEAAQMAIAGVSPDARLWDPVGMLPLDFVDGSAVRQLMQSITFPPNGDERSMAAHAEAHANGAVSRRGRDALTPLAYTMGVMPAKFAKTLFPQEVKSVLKPIKKRLHRNALEPGDLDGFDGTLSMPCSGAAALVRSLVLLIWLQTVKYGCLCPW